MFCLKCEQNCPQFLRLAHSTTIRFSEYFSRRKLCVKPRRSRRCFPARTKPNGHSVWKITKKVSLCEFISLINLNPKCIRVLPRSSLALTTIFHLDFHPKKAKIGLRGLRGCMRLRIALIQLRQFLVNFKHCGGTLLNLEGERKQFSLVKKCSLTFFYY